MKLNLLLLLFCVVASSEAKLQLGNKNGKLITKSFKNNKNNNNDIGIVVSYI